MANIRPYLTDTKASLASDDEVMLDSPSGFGTMVRDAFIAAVAQIIAASPSTYKIATLDGANKLTSGQESSSPISYIGTHDVSGNSPSLADGVGAAGDTYYVSVAGSRDYGSGSITLAVGDALVYSGSVWQKVSGIANILNGIITASGARNAINVFSQDEGLSLSLRHLNTPSVYCDGDNDYLQIADNAKLSFIGTSRDQPNGFEFLVNFYELGATEVLISKYGAVNREWRITKTSSNKIRMTFVDGSANECYAESDAITQTGWVHVAISCDPVSANAGRADDIRIYVNNVESSTATNNASYGGMSDTAQAVWIGKDDSTFFRGELKYCRIFNFAPTAAQWNDYILNGIPFALEWGGTFGSTYTSDFSAGVDSVSASNGAVAGNIDSIDSSNDWLRFTADTSSGSHSISRNVGATVGKLSRVEITYFIPAGQSNIDGITVRWNNGSFDGPVGSVTGTTAKLSYVAVAADATVEIYATDGGVISFQDAGGDDMFYVKEITVTPVGVLADFKSENMNGAGGVWRDASSNALDASNNGATLAGSRKHIKASSLDLSGIPTSSVGLSAGEVYSNAGVLTVV